MPSYVVTYRYVDDEPRLAALRSGRMEFFRRLEADGALLASGQLRDREVGDGLLVVRASDRQAASALLDDDPFVRAGVVTQQTLSEWVPTVGSWTRHG